MLYISEEIFDFQIHKSEDLSCKGRVNFILCRLTKQTRTTRLSLKKIDFCFLWGRAIKQSELTKIVQGSLLRQEDLPQLSSRDLRVQDAAGESYFGEQSITVEEIILTVVCVGVS